MLKVQASFPPLENGENKQSTPLVDEEKLSEDEWNNFKLRMYFHKNEMLYSLKQDVRFLIFEKNQDLSWRKISFYLSLSPRSSYLSLSHSWSSGPRLKIGQR